MVDDMAKGRDRQCRKGGLQCETGRRLPHQALIDQDGSGLEEGKHRRVKLSVWLPKVSKQMRPKTSTPAKII